MFSRTVSRAVSPVMDSSVATNKPERAEQRDWNATNGAESAHIHLRAADPFADVAEASVVRVAEKVVMGIGSCGRCREPTIAHTRAKNSARLDMKAGSGTASARVVVADIEHIVAFVLDAVHRPWAPHERPGGGGAAASGSNELIRKDRRRRQIDQRIVDQHTRRVVGHGIGAPPDDLRRLAPDRIWRAPCCSRRWRRGASPAGRCPA